MEGPELPKLNLSKPFKQETGGAGTALNDVNTENKTEITQQQLAELAKQNHSPNDIPITGALPVGFWFYEGCDDSCMMCLEPLMSLCPKCDNHIQPGGCSIAVGACKHKIHTHCVQDFTNKGLCLLCYRPWVIEEKIPIH